MRNSMHTAPIVLAMAVFCACGGNSVENSPEYTQGSDKQSLSKSRKTLNTTQDTGTGHSPMDENQDYENNYKHNTPKKNAMETVYDMTENSFSIAMPAGWQNIALMHRLHNSPRTLVRAISPDQNAVIFMGDPVLPVYSAPNPQMEAMYRNMGMNPPASAQFMDAESYFSGYIRQRFGHLEGFTIEEKFIHPDIVALQLKQMQKMNFHPQVSNLSFRFHYKSNGKTVRGMLNTCTISFGSGWLPEVSGYCTTGNPEDMEKMIIAMANSRVENPAWQRAQNARHQQAMDQIDANTRRMTAQHEQNMANIRNSANAHQQKMDALHQSYDARNKSWADQQASIDKNHQQFINSIRNEHTVMDASGNTFQVDNYSDKFFVDKTNNTYIGTHGTVTLDDLRQIKGLNIDNFAETIIIR